jgi:two-component system sensor histidine kinase QseC
MLLLVGGAATVVLVGGLVVDRIVRTRVVAAFDHGLSDRALALAMLTRQSAEGVEIEFADEFMPEFQDRKNPQYFQLQLADGTLVELSRSFLGAGVPGGATLRRDAMPSSESRFTDVTLPDGRVGRQVQVDFIPELAEELEGRPDIEGEAGWLQEPEDGSRATGDVPEGRVLASMLVARERESLDARLLLLRLIVHGTGIALVVIVAGLSAVALALGLRPVNQLAGEVQALDASRLGTRFDAQSLPRELRPIADQLNGLLERIGATIARERQLTSDIAHDLKTPVAELRALCDVAVRWPENPEAAARFFQDAREVALTLQHTIERLLALARHDAGSESVENASFDLVELVRATASTFAPQATARDLVLDLRLPDRLIVESDRRLLGQVLANLLENAVVHAVAGTSITCSLEHVSRDVVLRVTNQSAGLARADLAHVFERFWRKDPARGDGAHAGLGLPLARAGAELLGQALAVELDDGGLFTVHLRLSHHEPGQSAQVAG